MPVKENEMIRIMKVTISMSEGSPYCVRESDSGEIIEDSQKIWWPFDCDGMSLDDAETACRQHFPEDDIHMEA